MPSWDSIPESERAFQLRLMEIYAGFCEHTDAQVGKLVDYLDQIGQRENTIIFYIWGDNGSSAEGQNGSISELLAQNQIPNTVAQQIKALDELGGLKALGGPLTDNMYHAGWAWAGDTPFRYTKLIASHFGGTRNPLVVSWPKKIKPDKTPRSQFYHVNDIAPTLYDIIGIKPPKVVNGFEQDPDRRRQHGGVASPIRKAPENKHIQYFDNNGSRGIYHDGWYACTFGPLIPWLNAQPGSGRLGFIEGRLGTLRPHQGLHPDARPRQRASGQAGGNEEALPRPGQGKQSLPDRRRHLAAHSSRRPDQDALHELDLRRHHHSHARVHRARLGQRRATRSPSTSKCGADASGVLYALGGAGGGLTCYMDKGHLVFEYNLMIIDRSIAKSQEKIAPGKHTIVVDTTLKAPKPGAPADIVLTVDGKEVARTAREDDRARRLHRQRDL